MYGDLVKVFSTLQVFKQKALNYHWNVTGPDFYQLHLLLERVYGSADGFVDRLAEHIRGYGRAPGLYSIYLKYSSVQENLAIPSALDMLAELSDDLKSLQSDIKAANDAATQEDRFDTLNLLGDLAEQVTTLQFLIDSNKPGFNI